MMIYRSFSFLFLVFFLCFGIIGGCDFGNDDEDNNNVEELSGELNCIDGIDNDADSLIDCEDVDCSLHSNCEEEDEVLTESICDDELDNDSDGNIDCDDTDCSEDLLCQELEITSETDCSDGLDNDNDNETDCEDIDCTEEDICNIEEPPVLVLGTPILFQPINNQSIEQNDPDIGCEFVENVGYGNEIFFDWSEPESSNGIQGYNLFVIGPNAVFPLIDTFVSQSQFTRRSCNSFVIDSNLTGWEWTVEAIDSMGNVSEVSETGIFQFEPCRLDGEFPCNALPPSPPQNESSCQECIEDSDCPDGLFCFPCSFNCTGGVNRCAPIDAFVTCDDGIFRIRN